jgi:hypothetical protein
VQLSDLCHGSPPPSFRDALLGAGPESILTMVVMDSGLAASRRPGMTTLIVALASNLS